MATWNYRKRCIWVCAGFVVVFFSVLGFLLLTVRAGPWATIP